MTEICWNHCTSELHQSNHYWTNSTNLSREKYDSSLFIKEEWWQCATINVLTKFLRYFIFIGNLYRILGKMGGEQHLSFYLGRHFRRKSNVKSEPETVCYHSVSSGPEEMQSRKITGQEVSTILLSASCSLRQELLTCPPFWAEPSGNVDYCESLFIVSLRHVCFSNQIL